MVSALSPPFVVALATEQGGAGLAGLGPSLISSGLATLRSEAVRDLALLYPAAYLLLAIAHTGVRIGRKTYVVDLGEGNQRTDHVAVSNSAMGVLLLITGAVTSAVALLGVEAALTPLALVTALTAHDRRTRGHAERVRIFTDVLAVELGLDRDDRDRLRWALGPRTSRPIPSPTRHLRGMAAAVPAEGCSTPPSTPSMTSAPASGRWLTTRPARSATSAGSLATRSVTRPTPSPGSVAASSAADTTPAMHRQDEHRDRRQPEDDRDGGEQRGALDHRPGEQHRREQQLEHQPGEPQPPPQGPACRAIASWRILRGHDPATSWSLRAASHARVLR